jgi:hypothetical protein
MLSKKEFKMVAEMNRLGGNGVVHRFMSISDEASIVK